MRVFFDSQTFVNQQYGGISRYFCELITGINEIRDEHAHLSLFWSNNTHVKDYNLNNIEYPFKSKHRTLAVTNKIFNSLDWITGKYDLYHATYYDSFLINNSNKNISITTFHDMTYEHLSKRFKELSDDKDVIRQKKKISTDVTHIISVSENTKKDLIEYLSIDPNKISVVHLASSLNVQTIETEDRIINRPYVLFIGKRAGYKNFQLLIESIASILMKYDICLICGGGGRFSQSEMYNISKLGITHLVKYHDVNDSILSNLYKYAEAFVFPSLYEGFGIPILEAFSCGCPCILSDTSSLPEVAGEGAFYFDPNEKDSMSYAVEKVLISNELRGTLVKEGTERIKKFSWEKTVDETLSVYKSIL